MDAPIYIVAFVPGLPPELPELFAEDFQTFESGCYYVVATKVEFSGIFVEVELWPDDKKQQRRLAWFHSSHVLAAGMTDYPKLRKLGFDV